MSFSAEWQLNFIELKLNYGIEYCYNRLAIPNAVFFRFGLILVSCSMMSDFH